MAVNEGSSTTSPDPLAIPLADQLEYSTKSKRANSTTPSKALRDVHGNITLQDFYLTTPSARVIRSSTPSKAVAQSENLVSPWRIRVRVEAERDEDGEDRDHALDSPSKKIAQRTRTSTVPLKGTDDPSPVPSKRGRGRPRKSLDSKVKRKGTPRPARSTSLKIQGGTTDDEDPSDVEVTPTTKPKEHPKKNPSTKSGRGDGPSNSISEAVGAVNSRAFPTKTKSTPASTPMQRKGRSRTKSDVPNQVVTDSNTALTLDEAPEAVGKSQEPRKYASHALQRPRPTEQTTPYQKVSRSREASNDDSASNQVVDRTSRFVPSPPQRLVPLVNVEQHTARGKMNAEETRRGVINGNYRDPTDEHHEYDSIIESEGFSMVSVSTLPSAKQFLGDSTGDNMNIDSAKVTEPSLNRSRTQAFQPTVPISVSTAANNTTHPKLEPTSLISNIYKHSRINNTTLDDNQNSSPPLTHELSVQQESYGKISSTDSSSLPLPQPLAPSTRSPGRTDGSEEVNLELGRTVQAGITLREVIEPRRRIPDDRPLKRRREMDSPPYLRSSREHLDGLFGGFGTSTRRELRAGMRLGEELAKRQKAAADAKAIVQPTPNDLSRGEHVLSQSKLPTPDEPETQSIISTPKQGQVKYPTLPTRQLLSPERSEIDIDEDQMSWKADTPARGGINGIEAALDLPSLDKGSTNVDKSMIRREAEWQREREAVSKQIQEANTSQVIVIDDTMMQDGDEQEGDNDDDDVDIWQDEANSSKQDEPILLEPPEVLFPDQVIKPRRSKLPSPWRKPSMIVYSDEIPPSDEDPFEQSEVMKSRSLKTPEARKNVQQKFSDFSILSRFSGFEPNDESSPLNSIEIRHRNEAKNGWATEDEQVIEVDKGTPGSVVERDLECPVENRPHAEKEPDESIKPVIDDPGHITDVIYPQLEQIPPTATSTSWYFRITNLVPNLRTFIPTTKFQPQITLPHLRKLNLCQSTSSQPAQLDKPSSSSSPPFSIYTPWTITHYLYLRPLYLAAKTNPSYPAFNPRSPSAMLLGCIVHSRGWEKEVEEWELGVVDGFLELLSREGVDDGQMDEEEGRQLIGVAEVARRVFSLWVGEVVRGGGWKKERGVELRNGGGRLYFSCKLVF